MITYHTDIAIQNDVYMTYLYTYTYLQKVVDNQICKYFIDTYPPPDPKGHPPLDTP